jgi:predicted nucleic-acid-binding Zn-ribbon protein
MADKPKCPKCGEEKFAVYSMGITPTPELTIRQFTPKNFICCQSCKTIICEHDGDFLEAITERLDSIIDLLKYRR